MSHPLVQAPELQALLGEVTVLDVRYRTGGPPGAEEFAAGHLPGAVYVDLDRDLAGPAGAGGRHPLPEPEAFVTAMRRCGVSSSRPVVVYDDWSGRAAARGWWLLRHYGHPDVRVLDGGLTAWRAAGGDVETGPGGSPYSGDFDGRPGAMPVVDADEVLDVPVLVDARAPGRFRGEVEPVDPVAGHIPGAVNVPTDSNLDVQGAFRDADELRAEYAAAGAGGASVGDGGVGVAAYCGSGVTATHDVLAMELAGVRAALYPGSWSGWITDPNRPVG